LAEAQAAPNHEELIGRTFHGRFEIQSLLGRGGMGAVYKARQLSMDKAVALKVLSRSLAEEERQVQRFKQEALTSSQLKHPNTIRVIDYGQSEDGYLYLAMELLEGQELSKVLRREGALNPYRAVKIARQVCKSMGEAHALNLVHRDLKPDNIFLCDFFGEKDFVKVLDFGIAKFMEDVPGQESLTQTGFICGTPLYIAPEQALGRPVSPRTDLYSLGVILYEMLVGEPPFRADTPIAIVMRHIHDQPRTLREVKPDLAIPPELEQLVMSMLQKDPRQRPPSAQEVGLVLDDLLNSGLLQPPGGSGRVRAVTGSNLSPVGSGSGPLPLGTQSAPGVGAISGQSLPAPVAPTVSDPSMPPLPGSGTVPPIPPGAQTSSVVDASLEIVEVQEPPSGGKKKLLLAAAAVLVLGGGGAAVALLGTGDGSPRASVPKVHAPAATVGAPDVRVARAVEDAGTPTLGPDAVHGAAAEDVAKVADAGPVAAPIRLVLESKPSNAEVFEGLKLLGNTPVTVTLEPGSQPRLVALKLAGYKERKAALDYQTFADNGERQLTLTLEQVAQPIAATPKAQTGKKNVKKGAKKGGKRKGGKRKGGNKPDWSTWR